MTGGSSTKITVFNKNLQLQRWKTQQGRGGTVVVATRLVRASIRQPTVTFALKAEAAGRTVDMIATIRLNDFLADKWTHAEFEGVTYRIEGVNAAEKDMFVRLALKRT